MINDLAYNHKEDGREAVIDGQLSIRFLKTKAGEVIVMEKSGEEGPEGTVSETDPKGPSVHMPSRIHGGFELRDAFEGGSETWEDQSGLAPRQVPSCTLRTEKPIGRCLPLRQKSKGFFPKATEQIV